MTELKKQAGAFEMRMFEQLSKNDVQCSYQSESVTDTVSGAVDLADLPRGSFAAAVRDLKVNFDFFFQEMRGFKHRTI